MNKNRNDVIKYLKKGERVFGQALADELKKALSDRDVYYFEETTSTNSVAKTYAADAKPGSIVIASRQSEGRGRLNREWESPKDSGLYMTLIYRPSILPREAGCIPLLAAVAVAEAVSRQGISAGVKWPNDVILNGRKFCGILCETDVEADRLNFLIIGVGTNVDNSREALDGLGLNNATSIFAESGASLDKARYVSDVCGIMDDFMRSFEDYGFSFLKDTYGAYCLTLGKEVKIIEQGREFEALAMDINKDGSLRVKLKDDEIRDVYAGDVSVRGIMNYV